MRTFDAAALSGWAPYSVAPDGTISGTIGGSPFGTFAATSVQPVTGPANPTAPDPCRPRGTAQYVR